MKSPLDADGVWSGQTIDKTRVQTQQVHNFWFGLWIVLKDLQDFPEAVFLGVAMKSPLDIDGVWSGQTTDETIIPTQQVHNSWSGLWIVLKDLQDFPEAVFLGVAMKSLLDADEVWSGQTTDQAIVSAQQVHNSWSDH